MAPEALGGQSLGCASWSLQEFGVGEESRAQTGGREVLPQWPGASIVLGCIPDIYKACTCPSLRPNKEPAVCNRNMDGLMERGSDKSEARFWSDSPLCVADSWQVLAVVFAPGGRGD